MQRVYVEKSGVSQGAYYVVGLFLLPVIGIFIWGLYEQLVLGEQFGNKPASDGLLIGISVGVFFLCLGIMWLLTSIKSNIKIADKTVAYRFPPFVNSMKTHALSEIKEWTVVKKRFLSTGIGLRYDLRSGATIYSTGTKYFLFLETKSGSKVLISTQNPEEVKRAMELAQTKDNE